MQEYVLSSCALVFLSRWWWKTAKGMMRVLQIRGFPMTCNTNCIEGTVIVLHLQTFQCIYFTLLYILYELENRVHILGKNLLHNFCKSLYLLKFLKIGTQLLSASSQNLEKLDPWKLTEINPKIDVLLLKLLHLCPLKVNFLFVCMSFIWGMCFLQDLKFELEFKCL